MNIQNYSWCSEVLSLIILELSEAERREIWANNKITSSHTLVHSEIRDPPLEIEITSI